MTAGNIKKRHTAEGSEHGGITSRRCTVGQKWSPWEWSRRVQRFSSSPGRTHESHAEHSPTDRHQDDRRVYEPARGALTAARHVDLDTILECPDDKEWEAKLKELESIAENEAMKICEVHVIPKDRVTVLGCFRYAVGSHLEAT